MLILDPSSNEAEQTINILRNSGHAVRAQQITSESELETALEQQRWDLFVVRDGLSEPSAEDCLRIVQHYGRDIPFLMTTSNYSIERSLEVLRLGMQDVVPEDNEEYFKLVVERELRAINDRKTRSEASNILKEIEKRNELLLDSSRDAIAYITDGMHIYANNAYMDLFGYDDPDEISCIPVVDLIDSSQQEDFKKYLKAHAKGEDVGELSFSGVKENQEHFDAIMSVTASQYDGEDCTQVYIKLDKDDDAVLAEKLKELSAKDRVTGLYNQDYLLERIDEVKQKIASSNQIYSLIYLELDKFNHFVEEFGITEVDTYAVKVANWLTDYVSEDSDIARVGEATYAVLLKAQKPEDGVHLAESLIAAFAEHMFDINSKTYMDTLSVGVCAVLETSPPANKLLSNAHFASTRATAKGGNQVKVHDSSLDDLDNREDAQTAVEIQEAIDSKHIMVSYEPIVKLKGSHEKMYHARLVLENEQGNLTPIADAFNIGFATATAAKLDIWMIEQVVESLSAIVESEPGIIVKLNLTAASILDPELAGRIETIIDNQAIDKSHLLFEFNEEITVTHLRQSIELFKILDYENYQIAIGDYGSTLKSSELLESLKVPSLKWLSIDHTLMKDFVSNTKAQAEVTELLQFAHDHEYTT
ncbi:MAG: EAL domain-containing protein, partial [Gammaproteobacteria bacterium]|nr:EAL domain-containing protein [Gammaproteobacteria bacterium]